MSERLNKVNSELKSQKKKESPKNYTYKILAPQHFQAALNLFAEGFMDQPLTSAYFKKHPQYKYSKEDWRVYMSYWVRDSCNNGLCMVAFDGDKLIGGLLTKEYDAIPEGWEKATKYQQLTDPNKQIFVLDEMLWDQVPPRFIQFIRNEKPIDCWLTAIHKDYRSQGVIMKSLFSLNHKLWKQKGHKYMIGLVTNPKTANFIRQTNWMMLAELPVRDIKIGQLTPYSLVSDFHNRASIWMKYIV